MSIKVVLFDLDGTLLPMDQDTVMKAYFGSLAKRLAPHGYDPKLLVDAIWRGSYAMVKNDGSKTNEDVFWDAFEYAYGRDCRCDEKYFAEYYLYDFDNVQAACGFNPLSKEIVYKLKERGYRVALATNPLFPSMATERRIKWTGLMPEDFELVTTYENSRHCKPNLDYYLDIVRELKVDPTECLMVGNDVAEDMIARQLGMKVYLLTDCLLNKNNEDISSYPNGDLSGLLDYIEAL